MKEVGQRAWHLWTGTGLTGVWLTLSTLYVFQVVGFRHFVVQGVDPIGGFLEGTFAPPAEGG